MNPILFTQVPALDTVSTKLASFIDAAPSSAELQLAKQTIIGVVVPFLKSRFPGKDASAAPKKPAIPASPQILTNLATATVALSNSLPLAQLFPLVDMWRLAVLDEPVASWLASAPTPDPLQQLLDKLLTLLDSGDAAAKASGRNYTLTVLRLLANGFAHAALARTLLAAAGKRAAVTRVVVAALLHEDAAVRTAAAGLAFDVAAALQRSRVERLRGASTAGPAAVVVEEDEEWEVELVSAVLEALSNEVQSEEVGECCFRPVYR